MNVYLLADKTRRQNTTKSINNQIKDALGSKQYSVGSVHAVKQFNYESFSIMVPDVVTNQLYHCQAAIACRPSWSGMFTARTFC